MNAVDALVIEKKETKERIKALKVEVTIEQLHKQELDLEREITVIKKGGKDNGTQGTQRAHSQVEERKEG